MCAIKGTVQLGANLLKSCASEVLGHAETAIRATMQWGTNLLKAALRKLLGNAEAAIKAKMQWGMNLRDGTLPKGLGPCGARDKGDIAVVGHQPLKGMLPKLLGHVEAAIKAALAKLAEPACARAGTHEPSNLAELQVLTSSSASSAPYHPEALRCRQRDGASDPSWGRG